MQHGAPVAFLVGGPDGLSPACVARANERWSLSNLTLPHGLVRVVVAEALYRAWSLLERHPLIGRELGLRSRPRICARRAAGSRLHPTLF